MKAILIALIAYGGYWASMNLGSSSEPVAPECDCSTTYEKVFEGNFQDRNMYMQNPYITCKGSAIQFTVTSVTINDTISMPFDDFNASAFEIPLMNYNFQMGDPIRIVVKHYGCGAPKMLNPEIH